MNATGSQDVGISSLLLRILLGLVLGAIIGLVFMDFMDGIMTDMKLLIGVVAVGSVFIGVREC